MRKFFIFLFAVLLAAPFGVPRPVQAQIGGVWVTACPEGINAIVTESNPSAGAPALDWRSGNIGARVYPRGVMPNPNGAGRDFVYWIDARLGTTSTLTGTLRAVSTDGREGYASFTVNTTCPVLGSVRGVAFNDLNQNGVMDTGETAITTASWKLTGGGDWHICGWVGDDATYGPTVKPGSYTVIPLAQPGWRVTTPARTATVPRRGEAALGFNLGFTRDPSSRGSVCGQYAPAGVPGAGAMSVPAPLSLPVAVSGDGIPGALGSYNIFTNLLAVANSSKMMSELNRKNITLFAPTDAAFAQLPPGKLAWLMANPKAAQTFIRAHIVNSAFAAPPSSSFVEYGTLAGQVARMTNTGGTLSVKGYTNTANASGGISASNGVIFPVDRVLFVP